LEGLGIFSITKMEEIIQRGAEAILIRKGNEVLKKRVVKGYRLEELDTLIRRRRTRREGKLLEKAGKLIAVPKVSKSDKPGQGSSFDRPSVAGREKNCEILMEFIEGLKLSESLDDLENWEEVCLAIGKNIAKLHDADIIHGDLTTSNMIWAKGEKLDASRPIDITRSARPNIKKTESICGKLYFIDFGLGFGNGRIEDKAVDLHLIKQALEAKHFGKWEKYFEKIVEAYGISKESDKVLKQLEKVEKRGRYKEQY